jgi:hypothetical protein
MHRPLLTQTTSSRRTSQVTRLKKRHSLIAGLQPAAPILARRITCPLLPFRIPKSSILKRFCSSQKTIDSREKTGIFHDQHRVDEWRAKSLSF